MADEPVGSASRTWLVIVALVAVALVAWWLIGRESEEAPTTYEAGVTDVGGGELIVRDADEPGVPVTLPETPMTNVPAETPDETPPAE
jgi:hypothetical protein